MRAPQDVPVRCPHCEALHPIQEIELHIATTHISMGRDRDRLFVGLVAGLVLVVLALGLVAAAYQMSVLAR